MNADRIALSLILSFTISFTARGQSMFEVRNFHGTLVDAPVFDAEGIPLAGPIYVAELWGGLTTNDLYPTLQFSPLEREFVPFSSSGYFIGGSVGVVGVPQNGWAWLQVRAWDTRFGTTYEQVAALGLGGYGESPLFYAQGRDPFREPPELPAPLIGLQSFSLRAVLPEPSTWALLALGGLGFAWASRRKHNLP